MFQPFASWAQRRYQASLAEHLKDYGLRYDDLYDPIMDMVSGRARKEMRRRCIPLAVHPPSRSSRHPQGHHQDGAPLNAPPAAH